MFFCEKNTKDPTAIADTIKNAITLFTRLFCVLFKNDTPFRIYTERIQRGD